MTYRLEDRVALITGGGSGLGEAISKRFAEEHARVALSDINRAAAERVASEITANGGHAIAIEQDVSAEATWDSVVAQVIETLGRPDVVVNNAGIVIAGTVEDATLDDWRRTLAVNLDGVFLGCRAAVRAMKERGGSIINISSIEGIVGEATAAAYNASKGGVRILTKSAALHCAAQGYGIRVNSVHPGFISTPMVENALGEMPEDQLAELQGRLERDIPLGGMGEPIDIANGCLFLASDESKYMTGAELVIDGGFTAR